MTPFASMTLVGIAPPRRRLRSLGSLPSVQSLDALPDLLHRLDEGGRGLLKPARAQVSRRVVLHERCPCLLL